MEVINGIVSDYGIDIALNAAGYLIAGALGMLMYSLVYRRRTAVELAASPLTALASEAVNTESAGSHQNEGAPQFVALRPKDTPASGNRSTAGGSRSADATKRRDRADIMRLAREMIKAGAPHDNIKRTLPISDGELALLAQANR